MQRLAAGLVLLVLVASACGRSGPERVRVRIGRLDVRAELVKTPQDRARGLSGRAALAEHEGMLFLFPAVGQPSFWMKDMRFPLDFIWVSAGKRVIDLTENIPPPAPGTPDSRLPGYQPSGQVLYVLEVNAGVVASSGLQRGDLVTFDPSPPAGGAR